MVAKNLKGGRGSKVEGRASRILGQKPRSVGEGREKIIEESRYFGVTGQVLLTHSEFSQLRGGALGQLGDTRERGWTEPCVGPRVRRRTDQGARNLFGE